VVEAAADLLAASSDEPRPAISLAAAVTVSGAIVRNDISYLHALQVSDKRTLTLHAANCAL
jgi:hypothetical protein